MDGTDSDGHDSSDIDEGDLEDELMAIIGEDGGSMDELVPEAKSKPAPDIPPRPFQTAGKPEAPPSNVPASESNEAPVDIFNAPPPPQTVMEALEQRLEKYKSEVEKSNQENNSGKARRMGRIVKQYEEAIMSHKKGRHVNFDELPIPPGYGPIPGIPVAPTQVAIPASPPAARETLQLLPTFEADPVEDQDTANISQVFEPQPIPTIQDSIPRELQFLFGRQKQFKEAALNAKRVGDIDQAKEFIRMARGFDRIIEQFKNGESVDMLSVKFFSFYVLA
jgi:coiled-coil and C2 domain-containing protein 1